MNITAKAKKPIAGLLFVVLCIELFTPAISYALTSGPSQPESQSFVPVENTNLVNPFTGDFTYNIPLLDVEGYPINIAYNSGITAEDEASWVGLGWNINPGNISRSVRGIPDDFDGDSIIKTIKINPEKKKHYGVLLGVEIAGINLLDAVKRATSALKLNVGGNVNLGIDISNYSGVSASLGFGSNASVSKGWLSAGVNMGATFTTDNGVDLNKGFSAGAKMSNSSRSITGAINGNFGQCYNSREGLKYTSFGVSPSVSFSQVRNWKSDDAWNKSVSQSYAPYGVSNTMVPISMQNFVPAITNASYMESKDYQLKVGIEAGATVYPQFGGSYGEDIITFQEDGSRRAYGYFNLQNARREDITDFSRDRDGTVSRDKKFLPPANMTYDIYSVNGQATGGNFRPCRTDFGTVYDPYTSTEGKAQSNMVEIGAGNIFEAGWDQVNSYTSSGSGPWKDYLTPFSAKQSGSIKEPYYFKQAGELTPNSYSLLSEPAFGPYPTGVGKTLSKKEIEGVRDNNQQVIPSEYYERASRANALYFFNAKEASDSSVSMMPELVSYTTPGSLSSKQLISRRGGARRDHHASEFVQVLPDGRRYIYGIPAMNNQTDEYVVSTGTPSSVNADGTVSISGVLPYGSNPGGDAGIGQRFYMKTSTPGYAHSYLLTNVLSTDYADLTGNGISDDDLGSFTKFNYTRKDADFIWRTPYATASAQYDEGVKSDCHDDKGTFLMGSKEMWMLHSIETKNFVAFFYTSSRSDAKGAAENLAHTSITPSSSYKLDSILLYNKREWLANQSNPSQTIPIKKVAFTYDYSLCQGSPNSSASGGGKLTLKAISIKSGNSDIGFLSPYRFSYNAGNPNYSAGIKDMWGNYKPLSANGAISLSNHEFPYVRQDSAAANSNAGAWNLTDIRLPSGGAMHVTYEADDYGFVQNRRAMEMFRVEGIGPDNNYIAGSSLYQSTSNPYLYVYFKRKKNAAGGYDELYPSLKKTYLNDADVIQYNFRVLLSGEGERTPSCGIPLEDNVKGYGSVESVGICENDPDYGYVKLAPKTVEKMPALKDLGDDVYLNPVTLAAIFYAKYYNNKALYPSSEILSVDGLALIKQLASSVTDIADYFRSPFVKYLNQNKARYISADKSYIRLCSQGRKFGGGSRVKRLEFNDNWSVSTSSAQADASYGSEYDYSTQDPVSGKIVSSGVASYEPLLGGNENPFKELVAAERIGQSKDFPVVIPVELMVEGPIGESFYPSPVVGYSKVTTTSIHKNEGASSQTISEHEYYTAKDFPVFVDNSEINPLEDIRPKAIDFSSDKYEGYRVQQSYTFMFNDMHGKPKSEAVYVRTAENVRKEISHKKYEYYTAGLHTSLPYQDDRLSNFMFSNQSAFTGPHRNIGMDIDMAFDSREKTEESRTTGFMGNLNIFLIGIAPIPIPTYFPKTPKSQRKVFSSIVATKIIQQYGILKSVETFDKGASHIVTNNLFDAQSGQPVITISNSDYHNGIELREDQPAFWAYSNMRQTASNILYDERINDNAVIVNDTLFLKTANLDHFSKGDELIFTANNTCDNAADTLPETYRLWVVETHKQAPMLPPEFECDCLPNSALPLSYKAHHFCNSEGWVAHAAKSATYDNKYPPSSDNICNIPCVDSAIGAYGAYTRSRFLYDLLSPPAGNGYLSPTFSTLKHFIYGAGTFKKYPMEALSQRWKYTNPSFPDWHMGPNQFYFDLLTVNGNIQVILNSMECNWFHLDYAAGEYNMIGRAGSSYYPTFDSSTRPMVFNTKQVLKITVTLKQQEAIYATNLSDTAYGNPFSLPTNIDTVRMYTLADTAKPYKQTVPNPNAAAATTYTLYFPYDPAKFIMSPSYLAAQFNRMNTCYYDAWSKYIPLTRIDYSFPNIPATQITPPNPTIQLPPKGLVWNPTGYDSHGLSPFAQALVLYSNYNKWFIPLEQKTIRVDSDATGDIKQSYQSSIVLPTNTWPYQKTYDNYIIHNQWFFNSQAEIIPREGVPMTDYQSVAAIPRYRQAPSTSGHNRAFPRYDRIITGSVKIARSGRRNLLQENLGSTEIARWSGQQTYPVYLFPPYTMSMTGVLNANTSTYTETGVASDEIADPTGTYFNPYVTGRKGTPRIHEKLAWRDFRNYSPLLDQNKGILDSLPAYWRPNPQYGTPNKTDNGGQIPTTNPGKWYAEATVSAYSPWGNDLELRDAAGNTQSNIFGYDNTKPIATVKNAVWNNALYESFEDKNFQANVLHFFQNPLTKALKASPAPSGVGFTTAAHTGAYGLSVTSTFSVNIPLAAAPPATLSAGAVYPFYFRPGKKYIVSYWQQKPQNSASSLTAQGGLSVAAGGSTTGVFPKTPVIEGWVMYEREITMPTGSGTAQIILAPGVYDDVRILPVEANMKCYVYDQRFWTPSAILDENHMATFFEYDAEGKLTRVKKETEKGILTIKENRSSMKSILYGNGSVDLKN